MSDGQHDGVPLEDLERYLLGARPSLTRREVADQAGVSIELAEELWGQLGFPHTSDEDVAFTENDVKALRMTAELVSLGILEEESRPHWCAPGAEATPGWRSGRRGCWPAWRWPPSSPSSGSRSWSPR